MSTETMLTPEIRERVDQTLGQAQALKAAAVSLTIGNPTEAQLATEFVSRVAKIRKDNEAARKAEVGPLVAKKAAIDAAFKEPVALLEEADGIVRRALSSYLAEQERIRLVEEQRLAEERRRLEAEAEAERRRLAEAAEQARRQAEDAERARQAEIAAAQNELAQRVAGVTDEVLAELDALHDHDNDPALRAAIDTELAARRQAHAAAEAAQAAADAARVAELQVQATVVAPVAAPAGPSRATSGSASTTKRWTATVTDRRAVVQAWLDGKVPDEFVTVDEVAVGKYIRAAKSEHADHPGITYEQTAGLSVRTAA